MQLFMGIDPGAKGALAVIDKKNCIIAGFDWPGDEIQTASRVRKFLDDHTIINPIKESRSFHLYAALEYVHAMPKQGVTSMFKFGTNYGIWRGILAAFEIPFFTVRPQQWQKGIVKKAEGKKASVIAANQLFPAADLYGPRGGAKDGRADALLIALWCKKEVLRK